MRSCQHIPTAITDHHYIYCAKNKYTSHTGLPQESWNSKVEIFNAEIFQADLLSQKYDLLGQRSPCWRFCPRAYLAAMLWVWKSSEDCNIVFELKWRHFSCFCVDLLRMDKIKTSGGYGLFWSQWSCFTWGGGITHFFGRFLSYVNSKFLKFNC